MGIFGEGDAAALVACVADGAGSAKFSDAGSALVCTAILENASSYFESHRGIDGLRAEDAIEWCEDALGRIRAEAERRECTCRDLATTLSVAIVAPDCAFFFQIGDGAIILRQRSVYGIVFWPQSGEYANSTNFLTSDEYRDHLEFLATTGRVSDIALLTDGLGRMAMQFDGQTPHPKFFDPVFSALRQATHVDALNAGLRQFLESDSVQNRSDDDKTLIIACREDGALDSAG